VDVLVALVSFHRERGEQKDARLYAQKLVALDPADARAQELLRGLGRE
jgi:hypothetical protein